MLTISIRVTISVIEIDCSVCSKQLRSSNEMLIISFKDSYALQFNSIIWIHRKYTSNLRTTLGGSEDCMKNSS